MYSISSSAFQEVIQRLLFFVVILVVLPTSDAQIKKITLYDLKETGVIHRGQYSVNHFYFTRGNTVYRELSNFYIEDNELNFGTTSHPSPDNPSVLHFNVVSADNSTIIAGVSDTILVRDTHADTTINKITVKELGHLLITPDGSVCFTTFLNEGKAGYAAFDTHTGELLKSFPENPSAVSLSPNGRFLVLNEGKNFTVYDLFKDKSVRIERKVVDKRRRKTSEYFRGVNVADDGRVAVSYSVGGYFGKKHKKLQNYAVYDGVKGERIFNVEYGTLDKWYLYSIDPSGRVLYAYDKFYDIKTGRELQVEHKNKKRALSGLNSWKFHPYHSGVYFPYGGEGMVGFYNFE